MTLLHLLNSNFSLLERLTSWCSMGRVRGELGLSLGNKVGLCVPFCFGGSCTLFVFFFSINFFLCTCVRSLEIKAFLREG